MDSDLTLNQKVQIVGPRGSRIDAYVVGVLKSGKVLVSVNGDSEYEVVDREDIES